MRELIDQINQYEELASAEDTRKNSPITHSRGVGPWRVFGRRPVVRQGTSLVLLTSTGGLETAPEPLTAGEWAFGHVRRYFEVDVTERRQSVRLSLPCKGDVLRFRANLELRWQVVDPTAVVGGNVTDGAALFTDSLCVALRRWARAFDQQDPGDAEGYLNERLPELLPQVVRGVRLNTGTLELDCDNMLRAHELMKRREHQQTEITGIRSEHLQSYVDKGQVGMLTYHLTNEPEDALLALEYMSNQDREDYATTVRVVAHLIKAGAIQDVEAEQEGLHALESILDNFRDTSQKRNGGKALHGERARQLFGNEPARALDPANNGAAVNNEPVPENVADEQASPDAEIPQDQDAAKGQA